MTLPKPGCYVQHLHSAVFGDDPFRRMFVGQGRSDKRIGCCYRHPRYLPDVSRRRNWLISNNSLTGPLIAFAGFQTYKPRISKLEEGEGGHDLSFLPALDVPNVTRNKAVLGNSTYTPMCGQNWVFLSRIGNLHHGRDSLGPVLARAPNHG
jgi:hypothetical protein